MTDRKAPQEGGSRRFGRRRRGGEKEELRHLILEEAGSMFVELGYNGFSMRKLAERMEYSPGTLYLYFTDKDDLLFTVVDDALNRFRNKLAESVESTDDPWEKLNRLGEAYLQFGFSHPAYYQLMFMWRIDYLIGSRQEEELPRIHAFQVLEDTVRYALEKGALQDGDPEAYSDYLWASMHGIVALAIQMPMFDEARIAKLAGYTKEMIYRALARTQ
ncbi:TetR/AcrR family transcriptional regulator [Gorillibacterium sp. sgz5001074]|uniref:TetR/AcrR family transcriptional regulator n=1 Tax=Gorillibacterium sp. sgz5001074 TaxID=3446695 RepID=UPI003F6629A4